MWLEQTPFSGKPGLLSAPQQSEQGQGSGQGAGCRVRSEQKGTWCLLEGACPPLGPQPVRHTPHGQAHRMVGPRLWRGLPKVHAGLEVKADGVSGCLPSPMFTVLETSETTGPEPNKSPRFGRREEIGCGQALSLHREPGVCSQIIRMSRRTGRNCWIPVQ